MPTYEYECKTCKYRFERFQSMSDAPEKICPECGKEVRRMINGGMGIIFKGSGFYVNDSGGSKKSVSSSASSGESSGGKSETSQSESSKPESSKSEATKSEKSQSPKEKAAG